jgi:hypothetical protein
VTFASLPAHTVRPAEGGVEHGGERTPVCPRERAQTTTPGPRAQEAA